MGDLARRDAPRVSSATEQLKIGSCVSARCWCLELLLAATLYSRIDAATADYCYDFAGTVLTRDSLRHRGKAREGLRIAAVAVRCIVVLACVLREVVSEC